MITAVRVLAFLAGAAIVVATGASAVKTVVVPRSWRAELCLRAGYLTLRRIADTYDVAYDDDPAPTDPISITREEYDAVVDELVAVGVRVKGDRDQAWRDFAGWRVNYDTVLLSLCSLLMAPFAPWSSDRGLTHRVHLLTGGPSVFGTRSVRRRAVPPPDALRTAE